MGGNSSGPRGGGATGTATGAGTRSDVTLKLPQLQNLCKRDPTAYRDDYDAQTRRLESELSVLKLQPASSNAVAGERVVELIQFAAAVSSSSYKGAESDRIATMLMSLLGGTRGTSTSSNGGGGGGATSKSGNSTTSTTTMSTLPTAAALHRDVRKAAVSALILMRNKGTVAPLDLLQLFFSVMATVPDKALRDVLYRHMVNDIRNINKKGKRDDKVNRSVQSFLHRILQSNSSSTTGGDNDTASATEIASKRAVDMVCELYRRRVWTDDRTVAILASAVENSNLTVSSRAMRFFLGIEEKMAEDVRSQKESDLAEKSGIVDYHLHSRKTCRRARQTERALKNKKRAQQKKEAASDWMDETPDTDKGVEASKKLYPAMELLRDPQGLAETVFRRLKGGVSIKYETKLLMINFVTRLAGNHELLLLPLYNFLQKYMGGHQRDVTAVLAYTVQACHCRVPPDEVYGILKTISHNFITERCSEEQMAVGINAVRAICARVPACMSNEESSSKTIAATDSSSAVAMDMEAFARDLAAYSNHRDRSVAISGKAWMNFVREVHPALLQGKDRGLKGSALIKYGAKPVRYGEHVVAAGVEGADLLVEYEAKKKAATMRRKQNGEDSDEVDDDDASGEWEDVADDDEEDDDEDEGNDSGEWEEVDEEEAADEDGSGSGEWQDMEEESEDEDAPSLVRLDADGKPVAQLKEGDEGVQAGILDVSKMTKEQRELLKQQVSSTRIFTTADFEKMKKLVERENRAKRDPREAARRKRAIARGQDFEALSDSESEAESEGDDVNIKGTVNPEDIMATATRKRQSRADRLEKVLAGRTQFETKRREGGSTNIEKKRKKNFLMSKFSQDARTKGRGKNHSQKKKRDLPSKGTHDAKKRRRKA